MGRKNRYRSISSHGNVLKSLQADVIQPKEHLIRRRDSVLSTELPNVLSTVSAQSTIESDLHQWGWWTPNASALPSWLNQWPFILVFIRGGLFIREEAKIRRRDNEYLTMDKNERRLRLYIARTGMTVTFGSFLINIIPFFLAFPPALITLVPIVLSSVGLGFYSMTLLLDLYRLGHIRTKIRELKKIVDQDQRTMDDIAPEKTIRLRKEHQEELTKEINARNSLIKAMVFGFVGTLAAILVLSTSIIGLFTISPGIIVNLIFAAAALTALASSPAAIHFLREKYQTGHIKGMLFGIAGSLTAIMGFSLALAGLLAATATMGTVFLVAAILVGISATPTVINLLQNIWNRVSRFFKKPVLEPPHPTADKMERLLKNNEYWVPPPQPVAAALFKNNTAPRAKDDTDIHLTYPEAGEENNSHTKNSSNKKHR